MNLEQTAVIIGNEQRKYKGTPGIIIKRMKILERI